MPHTIYKYPFMIEDRFSKLLPVGSKILRVSVQNGVPNMWVLQTTSQEIVETRTFRVYGTGREIPDIESLIYIGTFDMNRFVWHVFEEMNAGTTFIEDVLNQPHELEQPE